MFYQALVVTRKHKKKLAHCGNLKQKTRDFNNIQRIQDISTTH